MSPQRINGAEHFQPLRRTLVAIGNFDGVHRGHQALLTSASEQAKSRGLQAVVLTFEPHPSVVLGRGSQPVLTPIERKVELISRLDPTLQVVVHPFTKELASQEPSRFVQHLLVEQLRASVVLVGQNFRFGHGRSGDLPALQQLGKQFGFEARAEQLAGDERGTFSSTRVRQAIARGDLAEASAVLGRPHALSGRVTEGARRGRTLGFPTANLTGVREAALPSGVYAGLVDRLDDQGNAVALGLGVMNEGVRPTVAGGHSTEIHVLDFQGDLYGQTLRFHALERLRGEEKFPSLAALTAQIERDVQQGRELMKDCRPDPEAHGAWF